MICVFSWIHESIGRSIGVYRSIYIGLSISQQPLNPLTNTCQFVSVPIIGFKARQVWAPHQALLGWGGPCWTHVDACTHWLWCSVFFGILGIKQHLEHLGKGEGKPLSRKRTYRRKISSKPWIMILSCPKRSNFLRMTQACLVYRALCNDQQPLSYIYIYIYILKDRYNLCK